MYLGKKIRKSSVALDHLSKNTAWETTAVPSCSHVAIKPLRSDHGPKNHLALVDLPGSISNLQEEFQSHQPCIRNTNIDKDPGDKSSVFRDPLSKEIQPAKCHEEVTNHVKAFIPYENAKLYIAQVAKDMQLMKTKHLNILQELEDNCHIAAKENQEQTVQAIRDRYYNKMKMIWKTVELYQDKIEKKNYYFDVLIKSLRNENDRLKQEKAALNAKNKTENDKWEKEKNKILELFSKKLDLLHTHQSSTLQELQMARLELGRVQEMLKPPDNPQVLSGEETHKGHTKEKQLEGAQARLEILKGTLYKREREITEFLQNENNRGGSGQYPCGALLRTLVEKAHAVYCEVSGARQLVDSKTEENTVTLASAKESLDKAQRSVLKYEKDNNRKITDSDRDPLAIDIHRNLMMAEVHLRKFDIVQVALESIRKGTAPSCCGKIRVFCRIRPLNKSEEARGSRFVVGCPDEYSVTVDSARGLKEFQFDKIFNSTSSQEEVFEDTSRLIQSAVDGYNVCIFAYGQTGSGKTFTMIGDKELKSSGVMPRAFNRIFHIVEENKTKFDFKVSVYMLELYNERLLDLFVNPNEAFNKKIEIKKDKKGLVFVQGAETKEAASAEALFALFKQGCMNRHIASTKMNVESSRSHLIIGVTIESTNLTNGSVTYGKLSLVDLAGSERAAKTGAKDEQLKEANSINKSLSALSDVIFALSTEQSFIPYRNNKLTQLMQDSLGGNAKTLMFVNISPADYNAEETVISLM
ncbi:Kinesin-like calmodulin-binding protein-like [Acipenser ruthenus]|uniref:Kinesin-like protein n=1 Tax=Acipenser ruthenus TaxID=7906 RepID=A0A444U6J1_ACIRT|nr:Kinesin-like calmodulin-binding protein-like [Acipenser ruthenus]